MKSPEILDEGFKKSDLPEINKIKTEIKELENKDWYGIIMICIVAALIFLYTIVHISQFGLNIPTLALNGIFLILNIIALFLSREDKMIAYIIGLIAWLLFVFFNILLNNSTFLGGILWNLVIIGSYAIFIYEAAKIKVLKSRLKKLQS
ncbi:MAG: hypothetical protein AAF502_07190 [Bacteroidota bacterium]